MDNVAALSTAAASRPILDIQAIQTYLPHREPFLFVDSIVELEKFKRAVGLKQVRPSEPFFAGHFPGHPVMPAVLIVEAMAQVAAILAFYSLGGRGDHLPLFTGIDRAKFRVPVAPGDQLRMEVEVMRRRGYRIWMFVGRASVCGKLAAEAELQAMMSNKRA